MALFNPKAKKAEKTEVKDAAAAPASRARETDAAPVIAPAAAHMLVSARITEKATDLAGRNVFVFNVKPNANKRQVVEAVKALYKVTPVAVRMVRVAVKTVPHARIGVFGATSKGKKAYVELKKGDSISLM